MKNATTKRRIWIVVTVVVALLLLAFVPPLVNANRFARRIASGISTSLGRPVHIDRVHMSVLPIPAFTLENFVVSEDPRFGSEPVMRSNLVKATLRISSLWRGKIEVSTISLTEPSVNLVQMPDGRWNVESILIHAQQVDAAPTVQTTAGDTPRFPYIEATEGRINFKLDEEKVPFSLTGAEFALWLPNPQEWRFRIQGKPARTDTDATDTGEMRAEATLRRAANLNDVPLQMEARWRNAQMGEAAKVLFGADAGWRGKGSLTVRVDGTAGDASVTSEVHLQDVRRADFVPSRLMEVNAHCEARATGVLRQLRGLRCTMQGDPSSSVKDGATQPAGLISVTGDVPSVTDWDTADLRVSVSSVAPSYALDWLRLFSQRIPKEEQATGVMDGAFTHGPATADTWAGNATCDCALLLPGKNEKAQALPVHMEAAVGNDGSGGRAVLSTVTSKVGAGVIPADAEPLEGGNGALTINAEGFEARGGDAEFVKALGERFPPLLDDRPESCATSECVVSRKWGAANAVWTPVKAPAPIKKRK